LFHPPTAGVQAERLAATSFREMEPPVTIHASGEGEGETTVGRVLYRDDERLVGIGREERLRHVHVLGRTGVGKSTLLLNQIRGDIRAGAGVCVIDPHGDLADAVARSVPRDRTNDVILFDPSDDEYAVAYNPLLCPDAGRRDLVADDVLAAFEKVYDLTHTPRLKDTLRNALYVLVEKRKTLLNLLLMLSDAAYRERMIAGIDDVVRMFWQHEFASWNDRYRTEALSAIQNKLRPFLMNRKIRAIVGQRDALVDPRTVMDEGKILIVPLSKGKLGEINVRLLGSLLVTGLQQAAMTRADVPEPQRREFFVYIDELHNFTTPAFASMLSEIRKYRVGLIGSHQFLDQLDPETAAALAGNVGSRIVFQAGADDAERLSRTLSKYAGQVRPEDLTNLPKYTAVAQLLTDGIPTNPFTIRTLPPEAITEDRFDAVRRASARQYARPVEIANAHIRSEFGQHPGIDSPEGEDGPELKLRSFATNTKTATAR
jgi:type IV secretory pathway TraG/TraD family ATPase VirD4